jgi:hypothetical protein
MSVSIPVDPLCGHWFAFDAAVSILAVKLQCIQVRVGGSRQSVVSTAVDCDN